MSGFAYSGRVVKIGAGANIQVDETNPSNPIVSSSGGGGAPANFAQAILTAPVFAGEAFTPNQSKQVVYDATNKTLPGSYLDQGRFVIGADLDGRHGRVYAAMSNLSFQNGDFPSTDKTGVFHARILVVNLIRGGVTSRVAGSILSSEQADTVQFCESGMIVLQDGDQFEVRFHSSNTSAGGYGGALSNFQLQVF